MSAAVSVTIVVILVIPVSPPICYRAAAMQWYLCSILVLQYHHARSLISPHLLAQNTNPMLDAW